MEETVRLRIEDVAYGGQGVGRHEGMVVFVAGVLPGEEVTARIARKRKNYAEGRLVEVTAPSPDRVPPLCPLCDPLREPHARCPGCSYQHAAYGAELRIKQAQLANLLTRLARVDPAVCGPPVPSPVETGYRNKIMLHARLPSRPVGSGQARLPLPAPLGGQAGSRPVGGGQARLPLPAPLGGQAGSRPVGGGQVRFPAADRVLGYFAEDNRTLVDVPSCPLAAAPLNEKLRELRADPKFWAGCRMGKPVTLRRTETDGVLWWTDEPHGAESWLTETTALGPVRVPRGSFFQVNPGVADALLREVGRYLTESGVEAVVDLYCGVGMFGLAAAQAGVKRVIGVDTDARAVSAAVTNARALGCRGVTFRTATAARGLAEAARDLDAGRSALVVDPPRRGLEKDVVAAVTAAGFAHVLYVSCAPDTLARDLACLREGGYTQVRMSLFDMFPRTACFETLAVLGRG